MTIIRHRKEPPPLPISAEVPVIEPPPIDPRHRIFDSLHEIMQRAEDTATPATRDYLERVQKIHDDSIEEINRNRETLTEMEAAISLDIRMLAEALLHAEKTRMSTMHMCGRHRDELNDMREKWAAMPAPAPHLVRPEPGAGVIRLTTRGDSPTPPLSPLDNGETPHG